MCLAGESFESLDDLLILQPHYRGLIVDNDGNVYQIVRPDEPPSPPPPSEPIT
jgi:hypothetical protein